MSVRVKPYHEWEAKHRLLNNKSVDGFKYWNYMRRDMFMSFVDQYSGVEPPFYKNMSEKPANRLEVLGKKAGDFLFFMRNGLKSDLRNVDALFLCHRRRQRIENRMVSIYSDFVEDRIPNSVTLERGDTKFDYDCPRYSPNLVYSGSVELMSYAYRYMIKFLSKNKYKKIKNYVKADMEEAFRDLEESYGLKVNKNDFAERVTTLYFFYKFRKPRYERFLRKLSPKVIVEVVGGGFDAKIINELAVKLGIPTIELQHGAGAIDIVYPEKNTPVDIAPDWYFTFSDFWKNMVLLPTGTSQVFAGGFPYHDIMMRDYPRESWKHDRNTIIFLSSRKYGKEMSELALELSNLDERLNIIFKLHPREFHDWKENYKDLLGSRVEVIDNQNNGLYKYFAESSAQVGVDSTAVYEGMSFELATYIWDIPKASNMKSMLCDAGYAEVFSTAQELYGKLSARADRVNFTADFFWKENPIENIVTKIKEIGKINEN